MEKKHIIIFLMGLFLLSFVTESFSQRRSSRTRPSKDRDRGDVEKLDSSFKDNLAYDIYLGNIAFNSGLSVSGKVGVGYTFLDRITPGLGLKAYYQSVNRPGASSDETYSGWGYYPYLRVKVAEQFYIKGEYDFFNFKYTQVNSDPVKVDFTFPMVGAGYVQGYGKWKFGVELMFMLNDSIIENTGLEKSDLYTQFDYNISFLYNF